MIRDLCTGIYCVVGPMGGFKQAGARHGGCGLGPGSARQADAARGPHRWMEGRVGWWGPRAGARGPDGS